MDEEEPVRLQKADGEAGETQSALRWANLHSGCIKGLWRSPLSPRRTLALCRFQSAVKGGQEMLTPGPMMRC